MQSRVVAALPNAGLANKLFVWAKARVFGEVNGLPVHTIGWSYPKIGPLLRGDPYLDRSFGWDDVLSLAQSARGSDEFGWRAEFIQLARSAQTAQAMLPLDQQMRPEPRPQPR